MRNAKGQGGPAGSAPNTPRNTALERELAELERRKLLELRNGTVTLTRAGYLELERRFPRRRS